MGACTSSKSKRFDVVRNLMHYKIHITAVIWPKNQHNLFDFESNQYTVKDIDVDFCSQLVVVDKQLLALTKSEWATNQVEVCNLILEEHSAHIEPISNQPDHKIWAILKSESTQFPSIDHWDLKLNDILKLGRVRMQLLEYAFVQSQDELTQYQEEEQEDACTITTDMASCRVCFSSKASETNPLISPCHCEGSVKYIHLECLQKWIGIQLKIKQGEHFIQYLWKRLECEICKHQFKNTYTFGSKSYSILKIPKPKSSYLTFKVTNDDKSKDAMIYVIEIGEKRELKIGRVPDCDIKLRDISVSRQHAIITLIPKENSTEQNLDFIIRVKDHKSKFGTLVLAQNVDLLTIPIEGSAPILYQTGRVLLSCCFKKKPNLKPVYQHPDNIQLFKAEEKKPFEGEEVQEQQSFVTNDMLNESDIIINNFQNKKPKPPSIKDDSISDER